MIYLVTIGLLFFGVVTGLLSAIIILVIIKKYEESITTFIDKVSDKARGKGYIIGLSEEEQSFKDSLKEKEKTGEILE